MTPHAFDSLIRQRLAALPPSPTRGWEALQQQLDTSVPDPAATTATDDVLAEKLTALAPAAPAGSWATFEQKLAAAEATASAEVDTLVTSGLERSAPVRVSGWALLAARLDTIGKRREMVGCMKVTEATFLLSMLLLFVQFGSLSIATHPAVAFAPAAPPFPIEGATVQDGVEPSTPVPPSAMTMGSTTKPDVAKVTRKVALLPAVQRDGFVSSTAGPKVPSLVGPSAMLAQATSPVDKISYAARHLTTAVKPALSLPLPDATEPIRYYLNVFASPLDLNQVNTRANPTLGIKERTLLSKDWSMGALLDITQERNGIQVGLIYANRSYVPAEILVIEDQVRRDMEEPGPVRFGRLRYNTVSIPLNYERVVRRTDDWQISLGIGIAANVVLASEFKLADNVTREELARRVDNYRRYLLEDGKLKPGGLGKGVNDFLHPPTGYLQGGSLIDNTSLYVSGNIRVERLLDERWSLYFSPTVSRLFTLREDDGGKGPLQDRIHNTMLRVGTRFRLTDK